jgi:N-acetylglucosamine kinase-like BadF-type ATPase
MAVVAGIDAGGTFTRLVLANESGEILAFAQSGCTSFAELGVEPAQDALRALWKTAWNQIGQAPQPSDSIFMSSGSILSDSDVQTAKQMLVSAGLAKPGCVHSANDAVAALAGGLPGRPGILVIAGTGSACFGRDSQGRRWRAGGWGHLLGDPGSAFGLGREAIVAATKAYDHRGPETSLSAVVMTGLQLEDLLEVYRKLHHEGVARAAIAALAPEVLRCAEARDAVAVSLVEEAVRCLAEMVQAVARTLDLSAPELALTGGLLDRSASYRNRFLECVTAILPGATVASDSLPPVLGALLLAAAELTGTVPSPGFIEHLRRGVPTIPNQ